MNTSPRTPLSLAMLLFAGLSACAARQQVPNREDSQGVPADPCSGTTSGWLTGGWGYRGGHLVFWPAVEESIPPPATEDADGRGEAAPAITPVLLPMAPDQHLSTLLPHTAPGQAVAVRSTSDTEQCRDELVVIDGATLETRALWSPERRILLLGRTGSRVAMLTWDFPDARVTTFDLATKGVVDSNPIELRTEELALDERHCLSSRFDVVDGGPERSGWLDARTVLLPCRGGYLCAARVDGDQIDVEEVPVAPSFRGARFRFSHAPGSPIALEDRSASELRTAGCLFPRPGPLAAWAGEAPRPCPEEDLSEEPLPADQGPPLPRSNMRPGLAVDGATTWAVPVAPPRCLVRAELALPLQPGDKAPVQCDLAAPETTGWRETTEGVYDMVGFERVTVSAGCRLTLGFAELAFALPPAQVTVTRAGGSYEVALPPPVTAFSFGDCFQGPLWLRARADEATEGRLALDWEYGYCE
ncbi:MAG: hypothetical protein AMXMBFR64_17370 [Myxococcales bacterium]